MIEAIGLTKHYRKKRAVNDVSFNVETGKVTGFLGPNGSGKTTTMRLMLGLDNGGGETLYDGKPLASYSQPSAVVGMLLEAKAFHPTRTARNHLRVLAAAAGLSDTRVDESLERVGLEDVATKMPGKFSLGMSQRLGIAAAILSSPKYLFLDEPANGLDPEGIAWLRAFIKDYADQGNGVLVSSHLLSEVSQMADNIVVIGKGKLIASTSMEELVTGSSQTHVFVRTPELQRLEGILHRKLLAFQHYNGGLRVTSAKTDDIGRLAFDAGVPVYELVCQQPTLETAFLELTADAEEYHAQEIVR
ncbi:MAG TPA: ATP-binding cassette domain-containing protein [Candidatus Limnocylindrales bacterium]|nr:ATP-binding cassette domain-containing protein [Candidatus Limnocylindrales bacterium]